MSEVPSWRPDLAELDALRAALRRAGNASLELEVGGLRLRMMPTAAARPYPADAPPPPKPTLPVDTPVLVSNGPGILRLADPAGGAPFAPPGAEVNAGQIVALLQAGAALWPVEASRSGRIESVLAEDASIVGYGTPLFRLARHSDPS